MGKVGTSITLDLPCLIDDRRLLHQGIETFHRVSAPSPRIFNLGDVSAAFKFFANSTRIGKVAVSCETDKGETTVSNLVMIPQEYAYWT